MKKLLLLLILCVFQCFASAKVSVIIPIYNREEYLPRCLKSIMNQSYKNIEIICINDGSHDDSLKILKNHAKKDPRIIIIDQKNTGVSGARNAGLDRATGEFISFVDSDDYIHPNLIEVSLNALVRFDVDLVIFKTFLADPINIKTRFKKIDEKKLKVVEKNIDDINFNLVNGCSIFCWNKFYKRSAIGNVRFNTKVSLSEDFLFNFFVFSNTKKYAFINKQLYYYEGDNVSLSRSKFSKEKAENYKIIMEEVSKHYSDIPHKEKDNFIANIACQLLIDSLLSSYSLGVFLLSCDFVCNFYRIHQYKLSQKDTLNIFMRFCILLGNIRKMLGLNKTVSTYIGNSPSD